MYIPDSIRIVARGHKAAVFSMDEGHDHNEALQAARVRIVWDELQPVSITVEYGTRIKRLGIDDMADTISVDYPFNRVMIDVVTGGNRTEKE